MAETKQGLEIALYLLHRKAMNKQQVTITMPNNHGANTLGVALYNSDAIADPHPDYWYDVLVEKWTASDPMPVLLQPMGSDHNLISGPDQFVYNPSDQKIYVSNYAATDTYKYTGRTAAGGTWSQIKYKRSAANQQNENVRAVHQWDGSVTHFKRGIKQTTLDFSMLLDDPYSADNMLLIGQEYGVVSAETIAAASWSQHDGTPVGYDIIKATLPLACPDSSWAKLLIEDGTTYATRVDSLVAVNAINKFFIDTATHIIYMGYTADTLPATTMAVSYFTTATGNSQEIIVREDYYAPDGSTVEFITLYPLAKVGSINMSNPDADDCTVSCNVMTCLQPCTV